MTDNMPNYYRIDSDYSYIILGSCFLQKSCTKGTSTQAPGIDRISTGIQKTDELLMSEKLRPQTYLSGLQPALIWAENLIQMTSSFFPSDLSGIHTSSSSSCTTFPQPRQLFTRALHWWCVSRCISVSPLPSPPTKGIIHSGFEPSYKVKSPHPLPKITRTLPGCEGGSLMSWISFWLTFWPRTDHQQVIGKVSLMSCECNSISISQDFAFNRWADIDAGIGKSCFSFGAETADGAF